MRKRAIVAVLLLPFTAPTDTFAQTADALFGAAVLAIAMAAGASSARDLP